MNGIVAVPHHIPVVGNPQTIAALLFVAGAAGLIVREPTPPVTAGFRLDVFRNSDWIHLDWDAADPVVRRAGSARLVALDGGIVTEYPLSANALRAGGLDYRARSGQVTLTLELEGGPVRMVLVRDTLKEASQSAEDSSRGRKHP